MGFFLSVYLANIVPWWYDTVTLFEVAQRTFQRGLVMVLLMGRQEFNLWITSTLISFVTTTTWCISTIAWQNVMISVWILLRFLIMNLMLPGGLAWRKVTSAMMCDSWSGVHWGLILPPPHAILNKSTKRRPPWGRLNDWWTLLSLSNVIGSVTTLWLPTKMVWVLYFFMAIVLLKWVILLSDCLMVVGNPTPPNLVWMLSFRHMVVVVSVCFRNSGNGLSPWTLIGVWKLFPFVILWNSPELSSSTVPYIPSFVEFDDFNKTGISLLFKIIKYFKNKEIKIK